MENQHTPKGKPYNLQEGKLAISRRDEWNSAAVQETFSTFYTEVT